MVSPAEFLAMDHPPSFSIVTPSYNQANYIRDNIESVRTQDYQRVEHIVHDNVSTDGTIDILRHYPSLVWVSEQDSGQADAVNKAIRRCKNEWIVWVNSDDYLLPGALTSLAQYIQAYPHRRVLMSNHIRVDCDGTAIARIKPNYSPWKLRHWWWAALQLWQPGIVFHRSLFDASGPLNEQLHYAMDFDFFLRLQDIEEFHYFDADIVAFRVHENQKGHASEVPFIEERIAATNAYWERRSKAAAIFYRSLLYFVEGSLVFVEALRQFENGHHAYARALISRGLRRNPLALLRPEHAGFWLRMLIGRNAYYRRR